MNAYTYNLVLRIDLGPGGAVPKMDSFVISNLACTIDNHLGTEILFLVLNIYL